ncbi:MAG TPA: isoaspartyl peptidase/L-asparaginase [Candidatus Thermoplasmatota archaeon]|nr:isoaspartyl peptidase/L-asparaginase [Candidatus Thermoplasmatota archaeon]
MRRVVIAHGGTASKPDMKDGTDAAVEAGMKLLDKGPLEAVVAAVMVLEDDERFNAGTGSNFCFDGLTIEMDAAVMDSRKQYGAVSGIRRAKNPVKIARALVDTPNHILGGDGADAFARKLGFPEYDPRTSRAKKKWEEAIEQIKNGEDGVEDNEWDYETLKECWNYERPFEDVFGKKPWAPRKKEGKRFWSSDTVGAVATDGRTFASATSTGGTLTTLLGRIGDTPNIGTGIFAGECGAVAVTGNGDHILRERVSTMIHKWMADGMSAQASVRRLTASFKDTTDVWACVIDLTDYAGGGNRDIAWSVAEET